MASDSDVIFELRKRFSELLDAKEIEVRKESSSVIVLVSSLALVRDPSLRKKLIRLLRRLSELSGVPHLLQPRTLDNSTNKLQLEIACLINERYPRYCKEVFIWNSRSGTIDVCVQLNEETTLFAPTTVEECHRLVTNLVTSKGYPDPNVEFLNLTLMQPELPAVLRALRVRQPATLEDIRRYLVESGYARPSDSEIKRDLDKLSKLGMVQWCRDRRFVLTAFGLRAIPSQATRHSADVARALHFGRRRW